MSKEDNSISFGMGLLAGILGGVVAAILYAPKSGAETREDIKNTVNDFAQRHAPEIKEAKKQAKLEKMENKKSGKISKRKLKKIAARFDD